MKCKYSKLLNRYADSELNSKDKITMDQHVPNCLVCSGELKFIQTLKNGVLNNKIDLHQEFFWQQLKNRILTRKVDRKSVV